MINTGVLQLPQHMVIFGFLAVSVIPTFPPLQPTNSLHVQHHVSSWDILLTTKGTAALISSPTEFLSHAMWCLMRPRSCYLRSPHPLVPQILSFFMITLTLYRLLLDPYSFCLQVHQRPPHSHVRRPLRPRRNLSWGRPLSLAPQLPWRLLHSHVRPPPRPRRGLSWARPP